MREGKPVTVVTGALGGLGTAIVIRLAAEGRFVVACDRRAADAEAWLERLAPEVRSKTEFRELDVTREADVDAFARDLERDGLAVEALVNNAGIQGAGKIESFDSKVWDRVLRVNLYGTFHATRAFAGGMIVRGAGRIVNFASLYAYEPEPGQSPYAAAKAGIVGFTHATALELAPKGITVNVIAPGFFVHERVRGLFPDEWIEGVLARVPVGRSGRPEEIAATVSFLLSDGAGYITGQTIHVNGGLYLTG
jgi:NAD(P)-dependent dehydrogenase (short-subunit alcohol dehydrogenase family)